ncbi:MAG: hypothetical protein JNK72_25330 [Myxococcales bacterium]|nr:hypothetical protein [Myxococcales bacterium]
MAPQLRWVRHSALFAAFALGCSDNAPPPFGVDAGAVDAGASEAAVDAGEDVAAADGAQDGATADAGNPAAKACEAGDAVDDGVTLDAQTFEGSRAVQTGCFSFETGPTRYYRALVGRDETLDVTATRLEGGASFVPTLRILPACGSNRCITQSVASRTGNATTARWTNLSDRDQTVFIAVSPAQTMSDAGRFSLSVNVGRGARNATCARAQAVNDGSSFSALSFADASDVLTACAGSPVTSTGATLYYRATVPPGQLLTATSSPSQTLANSPFLRVIQACGANTCLAHSGATSTSGNTVRYRNDTTAPREVIVAASNYPATNTVPFSMSFTLRAPPANASCAGATAVTADTPARGQNTVDASDTPMACAGVAAAGPALYHRVSIPAGQMMVATATRTNGTSNLVMRAYTGCNTACAATTQTSTAAMQVLRYPNPSANPQEVILAVSSATGGQSLTYDLAVTFRATAPNALCANAERVMGDSALSNVSTEAATDTLAACLSATVASGPVRYYAVDVPANTALSATLTPRTIPTASSGTVRIYPACGAMTCAAASPRNTTPGPVTARVVNGPMPATMIVAAGVDGVANTGSFDLAFALQAAASNSTCMAPRSVGPDTRLMAENLTDGRDVPPTCTGSPSVMSPGLWYLAEVPAGQTLVAAARRPTGTPLWTPVIRAFPACGATACLTSSSVGAVPEQSAIVYQNTTSMTERVTLAVNSGTTNVSGPVALSVRVRPAASNGTCMAATRVTGPNETLSDQHLREGQFTSPTCTGTGAGPGGFGLFYRVNVAAGQTLNVTATRLAGSAPWWPVLEVLDTCDRATCLAVSAPGTTGVSTARYTNSAMAPREVVVAVTPSTPVSSTLFDINFTLGGP